MTAYFGTSEELHLAYSLLKNAGMMSAEIDLLQEIAVLKERLAITHDEDQRRKITRIIQEKQLQFDVMIERQKKQRK